MISCGANHNVVKMVDGKIYAWGLNDNGQLGMGHCCLCVTPQHVNYFSNNPVRKVICDICNTFIITNDGDVYACGYNHWGQLGLGNCEDRFTPEIIKNLTGKFVNNIVCSTSYTFAITQDNKIYAWGQNNYGQLGLGHNNDVIVPTIVDFFSESDIKIKKIITAHNRVFAITTLGEAYSWGNNDNNLLGIGNDINKNLPNHIEALSSYSIKTFTICLERVYALTITGDVYEWGTKSKFPLPRRSPVLTSMIVKKIINKNDSIYVLTEDGSVYCPSTTKNKITFPENTFIKNIVCDLERVVAISDNSRIFIYSHNYLKEISHLINCTIVKIVCGPNIIYFIADNGEVFVWGCLGGIVRYKDLISMKFFQENPLVSRIKPLKSARNICSNSQL